MIDLRAEMAKLPEPEYAPWPDWANFRHRIWHDAQEQPAETWPTWPTVRHNFLSSWLAIDPAPALLHKNQQRYWPATAHAPFEPGDAYGGYSRNLVKQAGWIAFWEQTTNRRVDCLDTIFEFGGGFGATCYICRKLGFTGRYLLYDYPEMLVLQRWWLEREGIAYEIGEPGDKADLFIGLSSLSETTAAFRASYPLNAESYLLEWQEHYMGVDNRAWFEALYQREGMDWADLKEGQEGLWVTAAWR